MTTFGRRVLGVLSVLVGLGLSLAYFPVFQGQLAWLLIALGGTALVYFGAHLIVKDPS